MHANEWVQMKHQIITLKWDNINKLSSFCLDIIEIFRHIFGCVWKLELAPTPFHIDIHIFAIIIHEIATNRMDTACLHRDKRFEKPKSN